MEDDTPQSVTAINDYLQRPQGVTLQPVDHNPFVDPMSGANEQQLAAGGNAAINFGKQIASIPMRSFDASENLRLGGMSSDEPSYNPEAPVQAVSSMMGLSAPFAEAGAVGAAGGRLGTMAAVKDIRGLPVQDAVAAARQEPHLIQRFDDAGNPDGFIGGPPGVKTRQDLQALRDQFDQRLAISSQGMDWYDRYRNYVTEVTGGNQQDVPWLVNQHAQWSAGVSPEPETQFALKENNASLAGQPTKSARPAQHEAHMRAIENQDPSDYQLGKKTGEYARQNMPDQPTPGATGVNDFRYQKEWGYPASSGQTNSGGVQFNGATQHKFMDYETALAVDRANQNAIGGHTNWTGERVQAAIWVTQKAEALQAKYPKRFPTFQDALDAANTTPADYLDKHTAFATHEAQPGAPEHMPGSVNATQAERDAYADDPRNNWLDPTGRDALYGDLRLPGTGVAMRVRPSTEMQGAYFNERNKGWSGRPQVAFDSGKVKSVPDADRSILDAGESVRSVVDAQAAGGWHKPWLGGQKGQSQSLFIPQNGKLTPEQVNGLTKAGEANGLPNVVDTGQGVTMTDFEHGPQMDVGKSLKKGGLAEAIEQQLGPSDIQRAKVDSSYLPAFSDRQTGEQFAQGSGQAIRQMLGQITKTPELRSAFNNNAAIPQHALNKLEVDQEWAAKWGAPREDIQNARRIIGQGPGWVDRLEEALKNGAVLPATAVAVMGTSALYGHQLGQQQ